MDQAFFDNNLAIFHIGIGYVGLYLVLLFQIFSDQCLFSTIYGKVKFKKQLNSAIWGHYTTTILMKMHVFL